MGSTASDVFRWLALGAILVWLSIAAAAQAEGAPRWEVSVIPMPTHFAPNSTGNQYRIEVRNVGTGTGVTGEALSVTDILPAGLTPVSMEGPGFLSVTGWTCPTPAEIAEGHPLTCTTTQEAPPNAYPLPPIVLTVNATDSSGTVTNEVEASGGGATTPVTAMTETEITDAPVAFGIQQFTTEVINENGSEDTQAGAHPYAATATFAFNVAKTNSGEYAPVGTAKDINVELPPGFVGDSQAVPRCSQEELDKATGVVMESDEVAYRNPEAPCPSETQVGVATVGILLPELRFYSVPVYNIRPQPGVPAEFAFSFQSNIVRIAARLRSNGDYGLTTSLADIINQDSVIMSSLTFWGTPGVASHNIERSQAGGTASGPSHPPVASGIPIVPFLTNPSDCLSQSIVSPVTRIAVDSWEQPGTFVSAEASSPDTTGCNLLSFTPEIAFTHETSKADMPSGYDVDLSVPQALEAPQTLATPELKDAVVTLPTGLSVSPPAANGLQACSNTQFGLEVKTEPIQRGACPEASKIGTVTVTTPLLARPLEGSVFVAEPECAPCSAHDAESGRLFRLFIEVTGSGVIVKLPGKIAVNPTTGQLTASFTENPQLPFSNLELHLNGGPRAPLANPQACGVFTTVSDLSTWAEAGKTPNGLEVPGLGNATPSSSFDVDWNGAGGTCPSSVPFAPTFTAGTEDPAAGRFSPLVAQLSRGDREQDASGIAVMLPPGLLGEVAGIEQCSEAQANAGTCPGGSEIGTAAVQAGAGSEPYTVTGRVYLTGRYKNAPFGLSVVVPVKAGPFDLGTEVVRARIAVNPLTAALTVTSDPLPQSRDGIPFRIKSIALDIGRANTILNATNCTTQQISATLTGEPIDAGEQAKIITLTSPYTPGSCAALDFKPSFSVSTRGATSRTGGSSLTVKVTQRSGEANIHKVDVELPKLLPSRLSTLQKACTEAQFEANPAGCPAASDVGTAEATTPLLSGSLSGPAYVVSHGGAQYPELVVILQGENGVMIELHGETHIKNGVTSSKFETVPDAPISSFELNLPEGPHSVLAALGKGLCGKTLLMPTMIVGQDGAQVKQRTEIVVTGCAKAKGHAKRHKRAKAKKSNHRERGR